MYVLKNYNMIRYGLVQSIGPYPTPGDQEYKPKNKITINPGNTIRTSRAKPTPWYDGNPIDVKEKQPSTFMKTPLVTKPSDTIDDIIGRKIENTIQLIVNEQNTSRPDATLLHHLLNQLQDLKNLTSTIVYENAIQRAKNAEKDSENPFSNDYENHDVVMDPFSDDNRIDHVFNTSNDDPPEKPFKPTLGIFDTSRIDIKPFKPILGMKNVGSIHIKPTKPTLGFSGIENDDFIPEKKEPTIIDLTENDTIENTTDLVLSQHRRFMSHLYDSLLNNGIQDVRERREFYTEIIPLLLTQRLTSSQTIEAITLLDREYRYLLDLATTTLINPALLEYFRILLDNARQQEFLPMESTPVKVENQSNSIDEIIKTPKLKGVKDKNIKKKSGPIKPKPVQKSQPPMTTTTTISTPDFFSGPPPEFKGEKVKKVSIRKPRLTTGEELSKGRAIDRQTGKRRRFYLNSY